MDDHEVAKAMLNAAFPGTMVAAGADTFIKQSDERWYRAEDDSWHDAAGIADFHGHSGFSVVAIEDSTCGNVPPGEAK